MRMRLARSGSSEAIWLVGAVAVFAVLGIVFGLNLPVQIPAGYARYTAVGILAALDAVLGAVRAQLDKRYSNKVFISGFLVNIALAAGLTFLGDRLGVPELSLAAVVAFGVRLFDNLAAIRRRML